MADPGLLTKNQDLRARAELGFIGLQIPATFFPIFSILLYH
jgi:hypothetical protein